MTQGAIATGHPVTAAAGRAALEAGGNAFDAAVAATLAACVAEPMLTSLGGGGFLLAHPAQGEPVLFDFFSQTPSQVLPASQLDFYPIHVNFGDAVQEFHVGLGSIAVPGTVAGMFQVHDRLGRLPREVVFGPAIALAQSGVELNDFQAYCIKILQPILALTAAGREIYQPQGKGLGMGDRLYLPHLAETLTQLCQAGPDWFYHGEFAQQLIRDSQAQGGGLTAADLSQYRVIERSPLSFQYRGHTLLTNPLPSAGGALIALSLELLAEMDLGPQFGTTQHLTTLVEAMRQTNLAREKGYLNKLGSTTHISVIDREGNAASVTSSNGEGCGYLVPGTGVMLNNMLGEADLNPQGFHQWQPNQRLSSMMAPTLVLREGQPVWALGSGGSNRIRTAILQVLCNLLDFQLPLLEAVSAPRLHWEEGRLNWEPGFVNARIQACVNPGETTLAWSDTNMFFGGVHTVQRLATGELRGMGDPRRSGAFEQV